MKIALVHDWLSFIGGAEKVLEAIAEVYPSPIYTLIKEDKRLKNSCLAYQKIESSFIQKLPFGVSHYRYYLPFFPLAIEQFDLSGYEVILSTSHAVAKGILTHSHQLHICYCHTPMRYAWDLHHRYLNELKGLKKLGAKWVLHYLRHWDLACLNRVDHFLANSHYISRRIKKIYGRDSTVIYPPVATHLFEPALKKENFFLTVSRLVPYKKIDLIVEAFSHLPDQKLIVIGEGPQWKQIKQKCGSNVELLGYQSDEMTRKYLSLAKAFLFAAEEDFGIAPVEAQAAGTPVIAFGKGGVLESVIEDETGLFFFEQSVESLLLAIHSFERRRDQFDPKKIRRHAEQFSVERFKREYKQFVEEKIEEFHHESHHFSRR